MDIMICALFQQLFELVVQEFTPQALGNNNTISIDQEVCGNAQVPVEIQDELLNA
jgi:hypothetical protein